MRTLASIMMLVVLAACGNSRPPETPTPRNPLQVALEDQHGQRQWPTLATSEELRAVREAMQAWPRACAYARVDFMVLNDGQDQQQNIGLALRDTAGALPLFHRFTVDSVRWDVWQDLFPVVVQTGRKQRLRVVKPPAPETPRTIPVSQRGLSAGDRDDGENVAVPLKLDSASGRFAQRPNPYAGCGKFMEFYVSFPSVQREERGHRWGIDDKVNQPGEVAPGNALFLDYLAKHGNHNWRGGSHSVTAKVDVYIGEWNADLGRPEADEVCTGTASYTEPTGEFYVSWDGQGRAVRVSNIWSGAAVKALVAIDRTKGHCGPPMPGTPDVAAARQNAH